MVNVIGQAPNLNLLTDNSHNGFTAILQPTFVAHRRRGVTTSIGHLPTLSGFPNMDFTEPGLINFFTRPSVARGANSVCGQFSTYAGWQDVLRRRGTVELPRAVKALLAHQNIMSARLTGVPPVGVRPCVVPHACHKKKGQQRTTWGPPDRRWPHVKA